MDPVTALLIMAVCLLAEGFFSGSEIGVVSADTIKLRHEAAKGSRGARLALKMLEKPEWLLSTTLVGTNIAVVTNTTIATALMIQLFGDKGSWVAVAVVAPLIWVFGEIVPKSIFQQRADTVTPYAIFLLRFFSYLFFPILVVFTFLTRVLSKIVGDAGHNPFTLREEIATMLQMPAQEGDIQPVEKTMIRRMFNFSETTAGDVMVPLIDVVAVEQGAKCGRAVGIAVEKSHARLPVYAQRVDRIIGVLNTLDLLGVDPDEPITPHIQPLEYIPAGKSIKELLLELRHSGDEMVVVVDEFGGAEGIVTLEDIMEEVVEDMEDEYDAHDDPQEWVRKLGERDYMVGARVGLETLAEELGLELAQGNFATLAGFLIEQVHDIPEPGTVIEAEKIRFTIHRSSAQAIKEVRVQW